MTSQNVSSSSGALRQASVSSSADSGKSKRARTKHACDECRRSQKKCDGDKPLCRRCYLNGTHCTYTPHKSRNQCACAGQGEEARVDTSVPDVFIFPESSLSSFHTWSATSSPDQSPSVSGSALDTPSPTNLSQEDRFGPAQNTALEHLTTAYEADIIPSPAVLQRSRHLYSHRSHSLPDFSSTSSVSPSPYTTEFSPYPMSASLPRDLVEQIRTVQEPGAFSPAHPDAIQTGQGVHLAGLSTYHEVRQPQLVQRDAGPGSIFGISAHYSQRGSEAQFTHRQSSFFSPELSALRLSDQQVYDVQQYGGDQSAQHSLDVTTASLSMDYVSQSDHPAGVYAPWFEHGHVNTVTSTSSHARAVPDAPSASQYFHHNGIGSPEYFILNQTTRTSEDLIDPAQMHAHGLTGLPSSGAGRPSAGSMLLNLPSPNFSHVQWGNEPMSPPLSVGYPSSGDLSPSAYGTNDF